MLTEKEILEKVRDELNSFGPFNIKIESLKPEFEKFRPDVILNLSWEQEKKLFMGECLVPATPKKLQQTVQYLKQINLDASELTTLRPLVIAPYLDEDALEYLSEEKVSGVDLSGNGVIVVPGEWFVMKTGNKNQYPVSQGIKNIYRGKTSLVPRVFLEQSSFEKVSAIQSKIAQLGGSISLSTVSKALKSMEDDLIVDRSNGIQLLEPDKLLTNLEENYQLPEIERTLYIKLLDNNDALTVMKENAQRQNVDLAGIRPDWFDILSNLDDVGPIYTSSIMELLVNISYEETRRFPEFELRQTTDPRIYFASRKKNDSKPFWPGFPWCSPTECFLHYAQGDKREQETADKLRQRIIESVQETVR